MSRMRIRHPVALVCTAIFSACGGRVAHSQRAPDRLPSCTVRRVIDGDTIDCMVEKKSVRIRLIGIDAPELRQGPYGAKAKDFLARLLPPRASVRLETDVRETDRYGRLLAYVWSESGTMVNRELLSAGLAVVDIEPPDVKYADDFRRAASSAQSTRAGLWATSAFECSPSDFRHKRCR